MTEPNRNQIWARITPYERNRTLRKLIDGYLSWMRPDLSKDQRKEIAGVAMRLIQQMEPVSREVQT